LREKEAENWKWKERKNKRWDTWRKWKEREL